VLIIELGLCRRNSTEEAAVSVDDVSLKSLQTKEKNLSVFADYRAVSRYSDMLFATLHF
jgi:hypothetical protein